MAIELRNDEELKMLLADVQKSRLRTVQYERAVAMAADDVEDIPLEKQTYRSHKPLLKPSVLHLVWSK